jgi:hypothetical protein
VRSAEGSLGCTDVAALESRSAPTSRERAPEGEDGERLRSPSSERERRPLAVVQHAHQFCSLSATSPLRGGHRDVPIGYAEGMVGSDMSASNHMGDFQVPSKLFHRNSFTQSLGRHGSGSMSLGFEFVVQQLQKGLHHLALSPPLRMKAVSIHEQTARVHNSSNAHVRASGRRGTVPCTDDLQEVCKDVHEPVTGTVAKLSWVQHPSRVQRMHKAIAIKQEPATLFRNPASAIQAGHDVARSAV